MTIRLRSLIRPVAAAALIALSGCAASTQAAGPPSKGKPAPQWTEPTSTGGQLSSASLRGKPVYLNFFASWCPPCNEEAPSVNALQKKYAPKGLVVVGVDVQENAAKAEGFRKQHNLSYATVVDSGTLRDAYSVNGLPVHVFIDRDGVVQNITIGEMSPSQIENQIQRVVR
jgi:cytochrome c biogenesis protein CcmG/thiol:disulfide interchange protein DsbE